MLITFPNINYLTSNSNSKEHATI